MFYRILADLLVALHLLFVLFVVLGGLLVLWRNWLVSLHLPAAIWGVLLEFAGWTCPLTPWEQSLRRLAGEAGYRGGFIEHYLIPLLYPYGLTPAIQRALGLLVIGSNVLIYGAVLWRRHRRQ